MTLRISALRRLAVLLLLSIIGSATPAEGQIVDFRLSFSPVTPNATDAVNVTLFNPRACYSSGSIQASRNGTTVTISHVFIENPVVVEGPCEETTAIGPLPIGQYQVEWVNDYRFIGQVIPLATAALIVVSETVPVPTASHTTLALVAALMGGLALKRMSER